jgi:hypothetical protein
MFQKKKEKSELPLPPQILSLGFQNSYVLVYDNLINTYLYTEIGLSLWISVFTNGRLDENTHFISLKVLTQCCSLKKKKNCRSLNRSNHLISAPAARLRLTPTSRWQVWGLCRPCLRALLTRARPVLEGIQRSCGTEAAGLKFSLFRCLISHRYQERAFACESEGGKH